MIRIEIENGNYTSYATNFYMADDAYLFFKFKSPKSDCEIGIAYDEFVNGGDCFVNDGELNSQDYQIIDEIIFDRLPRENEFKLVTLALDKAIRKFNETQRHD